MLVLITGGSGSGKSAYAEHYILKLSKDCIRYYTATMKVYDEEGCKKVCEHQKMREGKGFLTIEQPTNIQSAINKMKNDNIMDRVVLLECISNLVSNEMFYEGHIRDCDLVKENVISGIKELVKNVRDLVIVTNNVFEDGIIYEETTMNYIKVMGRINRELAKLADKVIEVVVGIPITVKGED